MPLLYKLHLYLGLFSAIIFIMLAVTGIALNHSNDLKLDSQMVQSTAILDWYGIESPNKLKSFASKNQWLSQIDQKIYINNTLLIQNKGMLIGVVETDEFIVAGLNNSLLLLSLQGELIENISFNAIKEIGLNSNQHVVIKTDKGLLYSNDGLLSWHSSNNEQIIWSISSLAPESLIKDIKHNFRLSIVPVERVLLDIHSGRFFGLIGIIIVDISGIFLIFLSLSGFAIWLNRKIRIIKR